VDGGRVGLGGGPAPVGLGLDGAGRAPPLQEPDEEGEVDGEEVGDLAERMFAAIDGSDDALPEVDGVRTHESTSLVAVPRHSIPYVTPGRTALTVQRYA